MNLTNLKTENGKLKTENTDKLDKLTNGKLKIEN